MVIGSCSISAHYDEYPVQLYVITFVIDIATGRSFSQCTLVSSSANYLKRYDVTESVEG